ncbi:hypothetical protein Q2T40_12170 [Winogradskyella maritima]|uniref:Uncharacterized protein n=1 Tax=Winogradskyella maritima TaxID=1517766 RepID=A0ABV8AL16_9FLAO|nr:hypothetical protein [Winogradskyella maritima]
MRDFFLDNYSFFTKVVEIIPALVGLFVFKKFKAYKIKYLIYFLFFVLFVEFVSMYPQLIYDGHLKTLGNLVKGTVFQRNYWWYTIMWNSIGGLFYSLYFSWQLNNTTFKSILKWLQLIFVVTTVVDLSLNWQDLFNQGSDYAIFFSAILIIISVVFYFIEILTNEKLISFHKSINFYIACILLIWFVITTPLKFYNGYYRVSDWDYIFLQYAIYFIANFMMYIGYALLLILCKPQPHDA